MNNSVLKEMNNMCSSNDFLESIQLDSNENIYYSCTVNKKMFIHYNNGSKRTYSRSVLGIFFDSKKRLWINEGSKLLIYD